MNDSTEDESSTSVIQDETGFLRKARVGLGRFLMRVAFVYLLLYAYPFPLRLVPDLRVVPQVWHDSKTPSKEVNWDAPDWVDSAYQWRSEHSGSWATWERGVVDRVAADVFGYTETLDRPLGSGDVTYGYVETATRAVAAVGIALVWFLLAAIISRFTGRRDRLLEIMAPWMHLLGRYFLASILFGYGLMKVYPSQFGFPSFARLEMPYGDGSPMNILWNFIGSSHAYIVFSGVMEVLPALLLFTRRTALLGALLSATVMANVVLLNYCYDVPVKLLSTHLLVLSLALAAPDLWRLVAVFLMNRAAPPRDLSRPRTGWVGHGVRLLVLVPLLALGADRVIEKYKHPVEPYELSGIWDVEEFSVDGSKRIPRTDDALRFQALIIDRKSSANLKTMDGSRRGVSMSLNSKGDRLTLGTESDWLYRMDGDELVLEGEHRRTFRETSESGRSTETPRDPQLELRLKRDLDYVPREGVRALRNRVPEGLSGRWISESREFVGDTATRTRATPYGWDAIEVDVDGTVRVQYPMSEQEFRIKATPAEEPGVEGAASNGRLVLRSRSKFDFERIGDDEMRLDGEHRGVDVQINLRLRDPASFLLVRRGFHWINEIPLNRF